MLKRKMYLLKILSDATIQDSGKKERSNEYRSFQD